MVKRICLVASLLSFACMNGMDGQGKRSALDAFNHTLTAVVGTVESTLPQLGTITGAVEHDLDAIAHHAEEGMSLLGVKPDVAYGAAVVFTALYGTVEVGKYIYGRYIAPDTTYTPDAHTDALGKSAADADKNMGVLGKFVTEQEINRIVEAKWKELRASGNFASKDDVELARKQVINAVTQSLETTASRVTLLEGQVKGLAVAINGDPAAKKAGIVSAHEILVNRVAAAEGAIGSLSRKPVTSSKGGMLSGMFGRKKQQGDSDTSAAGDVRSHEGDDDGDGASASDDSPAVIPHDDGNAAPVSRQTLPPRDHAHLPLKRQG